MLGPEERKKIERLFGYVPEPEPLENMLKAIEKIVEAEVKAARTETFHEASEFVATAGTYTRSGGWLQMPHHQIAERLREMGDEA